MSKRTNFELLLVILIVFILWVSIPKAPVLSPEHQNTIETLHSSVNKNIEWEKVGIFGVRIQTRSLEYRLYQQDNSFIIKKEDGHKYGPYSISSGYMIIMPLVDLSYPDLITGVIIFYNDNGKIWVNKSLQYISKKELDILLPNIWDSIPEEIKGELNL